jgi:hypothetical protein
MKKKALTYNISQAASIGTCAYCSRTLTVENTTRYALPIDAPDYTPDRVAAPDQCADCERAEIERDLDDELDA